MVAGFDTQVKRSWIMASIITVTAVLLAIVARYTLKPWLVAGEPYFLFCVAVLIAAIAGGGRQALLAAILSVGAAVVLELVEPSVQFDPISVVTALALAGGIIVFAAGIAPWQRRSRSEEHTSELQSLMRIS